MPKYRHLVVAMLVVLGALAYAQQQPAPQGRLADVRVEGTTNYADIVKTIITARKGTPVASIDLEAERNRIYSLGTFQEVSLSVQSSPAGPVLVITVKENPLIGAIAFEGNDTVDSATLTSALKNNNLVETGRVYNTSRAQDAKQSIQDAYRQNGFPFDVDVNLRVEPAPDLAKQGQQVPVRLTYAVGEKATVDQVAFEGSTVFTDAELKSPFGALLKAGTFKLSDYQQAVQQIGKMYADKGFRGSGVDTQTSELKDGTLTVRVQELRIDSIDTTALGVNPSDLSLQPGDLFNYDKLLSDVKRLAQGRSSDIQLQTLRSPTGGVRVVFQLGAPDTAGPIKAIKFEGNTVLSDAELNKVLSLRVGDTFTSALAREDFGAVVKAYNDKGYLIRTQPDFSYDNGTYIQRVTEMHIEGYKIQYQGKPDSTKRFVITRYLPDVGSVANVNKIDDGLRQVYRTGAITPVDRSVQQGTKPDQVIVAVTVKHASTGTFQPSAQYATDTGLSASLSFQEKNFLGRAHHVSVDVNGKSTDLGVMVGGSLRYDIPWLYIPQGDFEKVPTSYSVQIFSDVRNNQPMSTADGSTTVTYPGLSATEANRVRVGEYTVRSTGLGISVSRRIYPNTSMTLSGSGSYAAYKLEPPIATCAISGGAVSNGSSCSLPSSDARQYLPTSGLSTFFSVGTTFDNRDDPDFPTTGIHTYGNFGVGIGSDYTSPITGDRQTYTYQQVTGGIRTYAKLSQLAPAEVKDPNHVFAVRLDAGTQIGNDYPSSKQFSVGRTSLTRTLIRGYTTSDFNLSKTYVTSSFEYRYNFNLSTVATQTVIGIAFVDVGWASSVPGYKDYQTPVYAGTGIGVQINLGFGSVTLPAIRMDYAFSQKHPSGVFGFRVGPVF
ncbi:MAG TPA: POTRA domain-containing protein [Trueperaceae bacterium]|nr:POTRA domain-containing protein [Trueperaceae bacterium]